MELPNSTLSMKPRYLLAGFRRAGWHCSRVAGIAVAVMAGVVAFLTVPTGRELNDVSAAYQPAWWLVHHGTMRLPFSALPSDHSEFHLVNGHWVSDRMPGMIYTVAAFSWSHFPKTGSVIAMVLFTSLSVFLIHRLWGMRAVAIATLCSPLLFVGGHQFWPQTIDIALLLLALWCIYDGRQYYWVIGPIVFWVTMTRPPFGLFMIGLLFLYDRRTLWHSVGGFIVGMLGVLIYTHHYFGIWSFQGGYALAHRGKTSVLSILYDGLLSPQRGLLFYTPWVVYAFRNTPMKWIIGFTSVYLFAVWHFYDVWGGDGYLGYRYALPLAIVALPLILDLTFGKVALLGWSFAISTWCLFNDHFQYHNPLRNANLLPIGLWQWGIIGLIITITIYGMRKRTIV